MKLAVLAIDITNNYLHPDGKESDLAPHLREQIPAQAIFLERCRERDIPFWFICTGCMDDKQPMSRRWGHYNKRYDWSSGVVKELNHLLTRQNLVYKVGYDGFFHTDLDNLLRGHGIDTVALMGGLTDVCVQNTAQSAFHLGYNTVLIEDLLGSVTNEKHEHGMEYMVKYYGARLTTSEMLVR